MNELKPMNVKVESVLIVVGSLFKQIGTPVVSSKSGVFSGENTEFA